VLVDVVTWIPPHVDVPHVDAWLQLLLVPIHDVMHTGCCHHAGAKRSCVRDYNSDHLEKRMDYESEDHMIESVGVHSCCF